MAGYAGNGRCVLIEYVKKAPVQWFHLDTRDPGNVIFETTDGRKEAEGRAWVAELVREGLIDDRQGVSHG